MYLKGLNASLLSRPPFRPGDIDFPLLDGRSAEEGVILFEVG